MISEALDGHPLALSMAADYIKRTRVSPREFLEVYNKNKPELSPVYSLGNQSMNMIIAESISRISTPSAKLLFSMCCILSLKSIPLWIFEEGSAPFSSKSKSHTHRNMFSDHATDIYL